MSNIVRFAPETPSAAIHEEEVTIARLASFLDAAVIDYKIDEDGDIYAHDGLEFPAWIEVIPDSKLLKFTTFADMSGEGSGLITQVNDMNSRIIGVQYYVSDERVWGAFWMTYDGGLNVRQFIKQLRRFCSAFKTGILLKDNENSTD